MVEEGEVYLMRVYKEGQDGCGCLAEMNRKFVCCFSILSQSLTETCYSIEGLIDRIKASRAAGFSKDLYKNLNHEQRLMAKRAMVSRKNFSSTSFQEIIF